jgi:hypothetical protein
LSEQAPGSKLDPQIPAWPTPLPAFVLRSPKAWGFVFPLSDPGLGPRVIRHWLSLTQLPPIALSDNLLRSGTFDSPRALSSKNEPVGPWWLMAPELWQEGEKIQVAPTPDEPDNSALLLCRGQTNRANGQIGCYQWMSRVPQRPGAVLVLRYRARSEDGEGRLYVVPCHPLVLPETNEGLVSHLRDRSVALPRRPGVSPSDGVWYRLSHWVTPTTEWQTYYVIWEWPPFVSTQSPVADHRIVEIRLAGAGKVWVDNVELFEW